jgi:hypothetical protein
MSRYQLGKGTLLRVLHEQGVAMRRQPMSPDEIEQAWELYQTGLSLTKIGQQIGRDHTVVSRSLRAAGLQLRDSHGREQLA